MYIAFGNRVIDSKDIKDIIEENTEFKVISININELDEDSLFNEYMASTEELGFELEEYLPEDSIIDFKSYKWDPSDNDIKAVFVMANEDLGYNKLKDVMKRLLTQVE